MKLNNYKGVLNCIQVNQQMPYILSIFFLNFEYCTIVTYNI